MGLIKDPKPHELTMNDGKGSSKHKGKGKSLRNPNKDGYSKPFNNSPGSKDSSDSKKNNKGKQCTYYNKLNHEESTCMKNKINIKAQILQQNNLGNFIPEGEKMKDEDLSPKKGNHHALVAINSSFDSWIIDFGASHHMAVKDEVFTSLSSCSIPPILMGDDTLVAVAGEGRLELHNGIFENVLHVPKLSINLLSIYHIT
jgi:hypothetical protein